LPLAAALPGENIADRWGEALVAGEREERLGDTHTERAIRFGQRGP
jgi:hypothetical protein